MVLAAPSFNAESSLSVHAVGEVCDVYEVSGRSVAHLAHMTFGDSSAHGEGPIARCITNMVPSNSFRNALARGAMQGRRYEHVLGVALRRAPGGLCHSA